MLKAGLEPDHRDQAVGSFFILPILGSLGNDPVPDRGPGFAIQYLGLGVEGLVLDLNPDPGITGQVEVPVWMMGISPIRGNDQIAAVMIKISQRGGEFPAAFTAPGGQQQDLIITHLGPKPTASQFVKEAVQIDKQFNECLSHPDLPHAIID